MGTFRESANSESAINQNTWGELFGNWELEEELDEWDLKWIVGGLKVGEEGSVERRTEGFEVEVKVEEFDRFGRRNF